jgi:NAD-dependent SIR2 family protein deacetylase
MSHSSSSKSQIRAAADAIRTADALLIGAGAGMGVDSGLPDFRGPEGFWKAYPPFRGIAFAEISTPHWFHSDPALAWGFFGHRLNLYRTAVPHRGFEFLRRWGEARPLGSFVFTSNVDGQFQRAGFSEETVVERHGSIHHLQCTRQCGRGIWSAEDVQVEIDPDTIRAQPPFPACPDCGAIARPNILMFGDWEWDRARYEEQHTRYSRWLYDIEGNRYARWLHRVEGRRVVAIELGAGLAIPTVRDECEARGQTLIRINPREADTPAGGISLPMGALEALSEIDALVV